MPFSGGRALETLVKQHAEMSLFVKHVADKQHFPVFLYSVVQIKKYSRLPITQTFKGNRKRFELSGVRVIGSAKKIAESKVKNSLYCTVNIAFNSRNIT